MKSLFILSLPRSMSTLVYTCARQVLGLAAPAWTMDGEILNLDRLAHYRGPRFDEGAKFTRQGLEPELFNKLLDFLTQVVQPEGFAYKDVVQPFVISSWPRLKDYCVLRIRRRLADVAYSMLGQGWYYPKSAIQRETLPQVSVVRRNGKVRNQPGQLKSAFPQPGEGHLEKVIQGLVLADRCLETIPGVTINYDDLIWNEEVLRQALLRLYPGRDIPRWRYISEGFCYQREAILKSRSSIRYQQIEAKVNAMQMEG